jgi:hypothetical protein
LSAPRAMRSKGNVVRKSNTNHPFKYLTRTISVRNVSTVRKASRRDIKEGRDKRRISTKGY